MRLRLEQSCILESTEGALLFYSSETTGRDVQDKSLFEFWHINALLLNIRVATNSPTRVELGGTSAVGISSPGN